MTYRTGFHSVQYLAIAIAIGIGYRVVIGPIVIDMLQVVGLIGIGYRVVIGPIAVDMLQEAYSIDIVGYRVVIGPIAVDMLQEASLSVKYRSAIGIRNLADTKPTNKPMTMTMTMMMMMAMQRMMMMMAESMKSLQQQDCWRSSRRDSFDCQCHPLHLLHVLTMKTTLMLTSQRDCLHWLLGLMGNPTSLRDLVYRNNNNNNNNNNKVFVIAISIGGCWIGSDQSERSTCLRSATLLFSSLHFELIQSVAIAGKLDSSRIQRIVIFLFRAIATVIVVVVVVVVVVLRHGATMNVERVLLHQYGSSGYHATRRLRVRE
jgi:hypothetical protein